MSGLGDKVAETKRQIEAKVGYELSEEDVQRIREALERQAGESE